MNKSVIESDTNVVKINEYKEQKSKRIESNIGVNQRYGGTGGGGGMSDLEQRVNNLEATAIRIETKLDENLSWLKKNDERIENNIKEIKDGVDTITANISTSNRNLTITVVGGFLAVICALVAVIKL
ncbi:hypothetical protein LJC10_00395 [Selenomonadales bacterium OttesenSCG-928-I06]|nr:hypothetical protein [Selenomonadales bacterium OttesenSCG-928-I06]